VQNAVVEITRKDFESTIERKIDLMLPADPKAMAQAAKLGKSVVEAERSSKLSLGISALAEIIAGSSAEMAEADAAATRFKAKKSPFAGLKNILKKK
jgi:pilus assembly protein CpaE